MLCCLIRVPAGSDINEYRFRVTWDQAIAGIFGFAAGMRYITVSATIGPKTVRRSTTPRQNIFYTGAGIAVGSAIIREVCFAAE